MAHPQLFQKPAVQPLRGVRVASLALNLPGPGALMRLRAWGADCLKIEPPAPHGALTADPMGQYARHAYDAMHEGIRVLQADLKTKQGQELLDRELAQTDVLITSFRPSALHKLGLGWEALHKRHPELSLVRIVGASGARAEEPGHDLTYLAEAGLVPGLDLPATLFADMAGALMASEAVLAAVVSVRTTGQGIQQEIALADAAQWLALPRTWGLTQPEGATGGAHAGYRIYACQDGRVALAALEPHFAGSLFKLVGISGEGRETPFLPSTRAAIEQWIAGKTQAKLNALAVAHDLPLYTLPASAR